MEQPDATVPEAAWEFHRRTGRSVSPSAGRPLRKLGLTVPGGAGGRGRAAGVRVVTGRAAARG